MGPSSNRASQKNLHVSISPGPSSPSIKQDETLAPQQPLGLCRRLMNRAFRFIFRYETVMTLKVHSKTIFAVNLLIQLGIILYIIFYVFLHQKTHLAHDTVQGFTGFNWNMALPNETADLTQCSAFCSPTVPCFTGHPSTLIQQTGGALFFPTRFTNLRSSEEFYSCGMDKVIVTLKMLIAATQEGVSRTISAKSIDFQIRDQKNSPVFRAPPGVDANISLSLLLQAAGVDLNAAAPTVPGSTRRDVGMTLLMVVLYRNLPEIESLQQPGDMYATAKVYVVENRAYHSFSVHSYSDPLYTVSYSFLNGTRVQFVVAGAISHFDFNRLFVSLMSNLALLAIAAIFVDYVIFQVDPNLREMKYKYEAVEFQGREGFLVLEKPKEKGEDEKDQSDDDPFGANAVSGVVVQTYQTCVVWETDSDSSDSAKDGKFH